jgi:hypothetical protein
LSSLFRLIAVLQVEHSILWGYRINSLRFCCVSPAPYISKINRSPEILAPLRLKQ